MTDLDVEVRRKEESKVVGWNETCTTGPLPCFSFSCSSHLNAPRLVGITHATSS
jgi:hypothetical protein